MSHVNFYLYFYIFIAGAVGYALLEILWRGFTHWTMALAGGICLTAIFIMNMLVPVSSVFLKELFGALIITAVEYAFGYVFNIVLQWNIWDYSAMPLNIKGQVCLFFTMLWYLICIPVVSICEYIRTCVLR